ncbi:MAG: hypothetical protein LBS46_04035 [Dysgonamonadaceae bacterium]|jgi:hypothetical protein|nr:hypothetical protein [Dysgonamonadaceae bacterium]
MKTKRITRFLTALLGAVCILPSCNQTIDDRQTTTLPLSLSVTSIPYGSDETIARSASDPNKEQVEILLENNYILTAGLEAEPASPMRADETTVINNAAFHVVAYKDNAYAGDASYQYHSDTKTLTKSGAGYIELTAGNYKFAVYSDNTTTGLGYSASGIAVTPYSGGTERTLLWGISNTVTVTAGVAPTIPAITLYHSFTRVKVKVSCGEASTTITGVSASVTSDYPGLLNPLTGEISPNGSAINRGASHLSGVTVTTTSSQTSAAYRVINTAGTHPEVTVGGTVNAKIFNTSIVFNNVTLNRGGSYILWVNIKKGYPFAGSNIYWHSLGGNNGYLTFHPHGYMGPDTCVQGVFFKWGSLIGMTPAGPNHQKWVDRTTPYVYKYNLSTRSWLRSIESNWNNIPYHNYSTDNMEQNIIHAITPDNATPYIGDICRFLGDSLYAPAGYRLPVCKPEFNADNAPASSGAAWGVGYATKYSRIPSSGAYGGAFNEDDSGRSTIAWGGRLYGVFFPAAGFRDHLFGGVVHDVGTYGHYWTGSSSGNGLAYLLYFSSSSVIPASYPTIEDPRSVRCVKN